MSEREIAPLQFVVFGRPQGKGSKRVLPIRGGNQRLVLVDSNRNAAPWAMMIKSAAVTRIGETEYPLDLIRDAVSVELLFYFARPRSHFGTGRNAKRLRDSAPPYMATMPDIDKLARCALDALTGVVLADDSLVAELTLRKQYGEPERLCVEVQEL